MNKLNRIMAFLFILLFMAGVVVADQSEKININIAGVKELSTLKGIEPKLAQAIVDFREKNGPFEKIEDIIRVKGIGQKKFESIKLLVTVGD